MSSKKKVRKVSKKLTKKSSKKVVKKLAKKLVKKSVKKPAKKLAKKVAKTKKRIQKKIQKVSKKSLKKPAKKSVQKSKTSFKKKKFLSKKISTLGPPEPKKSHLSFLEEELKSILEKKKQVLIKNSEGYTYCLEENCDQNATTGGYCRYHYIYLWDEIQSRNKILSENKIKQSIDQIVETYSSQLLVYMIRDLSNEKDFSVALSEIKALNS